jgi:hypothetical protein
MSTTETIEMAEAPCGGRGRPKGTVDKSPRKRVNFRPQDFIQAAGKAGYEKVRINIDNNGNTTLEISHGDSPDGAKGERNEWDEVLKE